MITKWKVANFKSLRDECELVLGPLTIFAGANSSGKSTVLQSMLLISQTLASNISSRSVVLNGPLTKLGQFDDLRSHEGICEEIKVGWQCQPLTALRDSVPADLERTARREFLFNAAGEFLTSVECEISFSTPEDSKERELAQLQPLLVRSEITCAFDAGDMPPVEGSLQICRSTSRTQKQIAARLAASASETLRNGLDYCVTLDPESLEELGDELAEAKPVGCVLHHFMPTQFCVSFDFFEEFIRSLYSAISEAQLATSLEAEAARLSAPRRGMRRRSTSRRPVRYRYRDFTIPQPILGLLAKSLPPASPSDPIRTHTIRSWFDSLRGLPNRERKAVLDALPKSIRSNRALIRSGLKNDHGNWSALELSRLPEQIYRASRYLEVFFAGTFRYLGPLRDEPKSLYPLGAALDPYDVGLRGEQTAAVLDLHKERKLNYISSKSFASPEVSEAAIASTLGEAVVDWMRYMELAENVETRDRGKLGHELKVFPAGAKRPHDLTHVGVGVSQVLPILVMCLLAEKDTTLVIEQPELHLHPLVQTRLADFFISMALLGKQCIIETHSEYLINRLRFRAARAPEDALSSLIKTYFVEKHDGNSAFRNVIVNRYGAIPDWPAGFFDQSQDEAAEILRAAMLKRKKERESHHA